MNRSQNQTKRTNTLRLPASTGHGGWIVVAAFSLGLTWHTGQELTGAERKATAKMRSTAKAIVGDHVAPSQAASPLSRRAAPGSERAPQKKDPLTQRAIEFGERIRAQRAVVAPATVAPATVAPAASGPETPPAEPSQEPRLLEASLADAALPPSPVAGEASDDLSNERALESTLKPTLPEPSVSEPSKSKPNTPEPTFSKPDTSKPDTSKSDTSPPGTLELTRSEPSVRRDVTAPAAVQAVPARPSEPHRIPQAKIADSKRSTATKSIMARHAIAASGRLQVNDRSSGLASEATALLSSVRDRSPTVRQSPLPKPAEVEIPSEEFAASLEAMLAKKFPQSTIRIDTDHESLLVFGTALNQQQAIQILALIREGCLVPVVDQITVPRSRVSGRHSVSRR